LLPMQLSESAPQYSVELTIKCRCFRPAPFPQFEPVNCRSPFGNSSGVLLPTPTHRHFPARQLLHYSRSDGDMLFLTRPSLPQLLFYARARLVSEGPRSARSVRAQRGGIRAITNSPYLAQIPLHLCYARPRGPLLVQVKWPCRVALACDAFSRPPYHQADVTLLEFFYRTTRLSRALLTPLILIK